MSRNQQPTHAQLSVHPSNWAAHTAGPDWTDSVVLCVSMVAVSGFTHKELQHRRTEPGRQSHTEAGVERLPVWEKFWSARKSLGGSKSKRTWLMAAEQSHPSPEQHDLHYHALLTGWIQLWPEKIYTLRIKCRNCDVTRLCWFYSPSQNPSKSCWRQTWWCFCIIWCFIKC